MKLLKHYLRKKEHHFTKKASRIRLNRKVISQSIFLFIYHSAISAWSLRWNKSRWQKTFKQKCSSVSLDFLVGFSHGCKHDNLDGASNNPHKKKKKNQTKNKMKNKKWNIFKVSNVQLKLSSNFRSAMFDKRFSAVLNRKDKISLNILKIALN